MNEALFGIIRADIDRLVELAEGVGYIEGLEEEGSHYHFWSMEEAVKMRDDARDVLLKRITEAMK